MSGKIAAQMSKNDSEPFRNVDLGSLCPRSPVAGGGSERSGPQVKSTSSIVSLHPGMKAAGSTSEDSMTESVDDILAARKPDLQSRKEKDEGSELQIEIT